MCVFDVRRLIDCVILERNHLSQYDLSGIMVAYKLELAAFVLAVMLQWVSQSVRATSIANSYIVHTIDRHPSDVLAEIRVSDKQMDSNRVLRSNLNTIEGARITLDDFMEQDISSHGRTLDSGPMRKEYYGLIRIQSVDDLEHLKLSPYLISITPNMEIHGDEFTDKWNLDRIDQAFGLDGEYTPTQEQGQNVDLYIVDSGVWNEHAEFSDSSKRNSRVQVGFSTYTDTTGNDDCNGHGTHVASIAAGNTAGVARMATIIPVRVLDCAARSSTWMTLQGISWVSSTIQQRAKLGRRSVVNLSLSAAETLEPLDRAVSELVKLGAIVVTAAGNNNHDACINSPGREPSVINVGSMAKDESRAASSNFGPCVSMFAPGESIIGAFPMKDMYLTKSGTSMAAPLVAGVAATLLERRPHSSPAEIKAQLLEMGTSTSPAYDDDCVGVLPASVKTLQSLPVDSGNTEDSFGLEETRIISSADFSWWSPRAVLSPLAKTQSFCIDFDARLLDPSQGGRISVLVSSTEYTAGIASLDRKTQSPCDIRPAGWLMLDSSMNGMLILRTGNEASARGTIASGGVKSLKVPLNFERSLRMSLQFNILSNSQGHFKASYWDPRADAEVVLFDQDVDIPKNWMTDSLKVSFKGSDIGPNGLLISNFGQCLEASRGIGSTLSPTLLQTKSPSQMPTIKPTTFTKGPTGPPTMNPTKTPTSKPTNIPTNKPTKKPTNSPTKKPTKAPTSLPTRKPTKTPSSRPTKRPTHKPTRKPTKAPTTKKRSKTSAKK